MFKYNLSSLSSKVAMTVAGALFITLGAIAAPQFPPEPPEPECYGDWRITGTTYDGNSVDETRRGYVYGCKVYWEGHSVLACYLTRGRDGRVAHWFDGPDKDRCPELVQVFNPSPYPDELFQVTIEPY